jgi:peroxiredoxin
MNNLSKTTCTSCHTHASAILLGLVICMTLVVGSVTYHVVAQESKVPATTETKQQPPPKEFQAAPELEKISGWINSRPLELMKLRGQVVVLHFWTFGCINCVRNLPHYNQWQQDFAKDKVTIIGVHTPEFDHEAKPDALKAAVEKHQIQFPVALDPEQATWDAFQNRYWPTVYLIDKQGKIRLRWEGELEHNNAGGDQLVRQKLKELLAE